MSKQIEAMKLALEALKNCRENLFLKDYVEHIDLTITALREALAEQPAQQKPVAWMCHPFGDAECEFSERQECENCVPLYTTPQAQPDREWVGLTDEDKDFIELTGGKSDVLLAELVEAKLKEKNT